MPFSCVFHLLLPDETGGPVSKGCAVGKTKLGAWPEIVPELLQMRIPMEQQQQK